MSNWIQITIYGMLSLVLLFEGILSFMHRENYFLKGRTSSRKNDRLTGIMLCGASVTAMMFGLRIVWKVSWAKEGLWIGIITAMIPAVILLVDEQRRGNE